MSKDLFRKRNIGLFIKVVIAFVALWFIYREVQLKDQETDLSFGIDFLLAAEQLHYLLGLVLLMLLNWTLEAYKWKILIQHIEKISLLKSLIAIFSGITIAIFTPNRVGEYGGRIFHLQKADRIDATLLTIVGSYAQLVVTLVTGIIASIFFIPDHVGIGPLTPLQYNLIGVLMFGVAIFLILLFLNTRLLTTAINWLPVPKLYETKGSPLITRWTHSASNLWRRATLALLSYSKVFQYHTTGTLLKVFLASLGRYAVFTFQFYLLLRVFDVAVNYGEAMMMISMTYFVMTAVPTIAITELVTRGAIATKFLEILSPNVTGIVSSSSMLWLINLAIPALIGVIFIFQLKFFRKSD